MNQGETEINSLKMGFASVPTFNPIKSEVEIISIKTPKNRNKTGKSIEYVNVKKMTL